MITPYYIFASSKLWHRDAFDTLRSERPENWAWASTPQELEQAISIGAPRYVFFLHWNWHVPSHIWSPHECVCFHMTDVPYGRGGSPLQNLIKAGHKTTKLTALRMVEGMDQGPVYTKLPLSLAGRAEDIYRRAGALSVDLIRWIIDTTPVPTPQQGEIVTFKRRKPADSALPMHCDTESLYDHIRMVDAPGYPLAFIQHGEFRLEFSNAQMEDDGLHARVVIRKHPNDKQD
ncbi:MAG TPA: hypothetical protein VL001_05435 [Candidimonas sp.]|nr:hypothetical protein [Candidimonas sp.]